MSARTLKVDLIMPFEQILRIPTGKIEIPELEFFLGTTRVQCTLCTAFLAHIINIPNVYIHTLGLTLCG